MRFQIFLCAGGTGGRLKGICDLIITPSPHLSDPAAFISLSAPLSPCHFPPLSLFTALFPHLSFIQSLSSRFLSVFCPSPWCSVGSNCPCCMLAEGEWKIQYYWEKEGERRPISLDKLGKMRTSLILPQINRLREMMPIREWNTICSHHCYLLTYSVCTDYVHMRRHILPTWGKAFRQDSGLGWAWSNTRLSHMKKTCHNHTLL